MNWMKKGPELKLSELKVPDFLVDLWYDLKDRHLLPLVAILLVAMIAMPIILEHSQHSEEEGPVASPSATRASTAAGGDEAIIVASSAPGLRDARRRLSRRRALDPFTKKVVEATVETGGEGTAAPSEEGSSTSSKVEVTGEATPIEGGASNSSTGEIQAPAEPHVPAEAAAPAEGHHSSGSSDPSTGGLTRTRYASNAIDVRIVSLPPPSSDAAAEKQANQKASAQERRNLPELTMLPARATPAVTFMGTTGDGKKALLLVSSDVQSIFGEASCVIGSKTCQLLALEPGLPETFVYGPRERTYRIELLKINRTLSAKPRRASLGSANTGKQAGAGQKKPEAEAAAPSEPAGRVEAGTSAGG
jgi:hypothetical protein